MQSDASSLVPVNSPNCHWMSESRNLGLNFMYSNSNEKKIRAGIRQIQQGTSDQKTVFPPLIFTVFHVGFEACMVLITCRKFITFLGRLSSQDLKMMHLTAFGDPSFARDLFFAKITSLTLTNSNQGASEGYCVMSYKISNPHWWTIWSSKGFAIRPGIAEKQGC